MLLVITCVLSFACIVASVPTVSTLEAGKPSTTKSSRLSQSTDSAFAELSVWQWRKLNDIRLLARLPMKSRLAVVSPMRIQRLVHRVGPVANESTPSPRAHKRQTPASDQFVAVQIPVDAKKPTKNQYDSNVTTQNLKSNAFIGGEWIHSGVSVSRMFMTLLHGMPRNALASGESLYQWPDPLPKTNWDSISSNKYVKSLETLWFVPVFFAGFILLLWSVWFFARAFCNRCGKRWATELYPEGETHCYMFGFVVLSILCGFACAFAWTGHVRFVRSLDNSLAATDYGMEHFSDFAPLLTQAYAQAAQLAVNKMSNLADMLQEGFNTHLGTKSEITSCLSSVVAPLQAMEALAAPLVDVSLTPAAASGLVADLTALQTPRNAAHTLLSQAATTTDSLRAALLDVTVPDDGAPADESARVAKYNATNVADSFSAWADAHAPIRENVLQTHASFSSDLASFETLIATSLKNEVSDPLKILAQALTGLPDITSLTDELYELATVNQMHYFQEAFGELNTALKTLPSLSALDSKLREHLGASAPYGANIAASAANLQAVLQGPSVKGEMTTMLGDPDAAYFLDAVTKLQAVFTLASQLGTRIGADGVLASIISTLARKARSAQLNVVKLRKGLTSLSTLLGQDGATLVANLNSATNDLTSLTCYPEVYTRLQGIQNTLGKVNGLTKHIVDTGAFLTTIIENATTLTAQASAAQQSLADIDAARTSSGINDSDLSDVQQRLDELRSSLTQVLSPIQDEDLDERQLLADAGDSSTVNFPSSDAISQDPLLLNNYQRVFDFDASGKELTGTPSLYATDTEIHSAAQSDRASLATLVRSLQTAVSAATTYTTVVTRAMEAASFNGYVDETETAVTNLETALNELDTTYYPSGLETEVYTPLNALASAIEDCSPHIEEAVEFLDVISEAVYPSIGGLPAETKDALVICLPALDGAISSLPSLSTLATRVETITSLSNTIATSAQKAWAAVVDEVPSSSVKDDLLADLNKLLPYVAGAQASPKLYQRVVAMAPSSLSVAQQPLGILTAELDATTKPLPLEADGSYPGPGALVDVNALTTFSTDAEAAASTGLSAYAAAIDSRGFVLAQPDYTPSTGPPPEPYTNARGAPAITYIDQELARLDDLHNVIPWDVFDKKAEYESSIAKGLEFRDALNSVYASYQSTRNTLDSDFKRWNGVRLLAANLIVMLPMILGVATFWSGWKRRHGWALFLALIWFTSAILLFLLLAVELSLAAVTGDQCVDPVEALTYHLSGYVYNPWGPGEFLNQPILSVPATLPYFLHCEGDTDAQRPPFLNALATPTGIMDQLGVNVKSITASMQAVEGITLATSVQTILNQLIAYQNTAEAASMSIRAKLDCTLTSDIYTRVKDAFCDTSAPSIALSAFMVLLQAIFATLGALCAARSYKRFNRRWLLDDMRFVNPYIAESLGVAPFSLSNSKDLAKYATRRAQAIDRRESMRSLADKLSNGNKATKLGGRGAMFGKASIQVHADPEEALTQAALMENDKTSTAVAQPVPTLAALSNRNERAMYARRQSLEQSASGSTEGKQYSGLPVNIHLSSDTVKPEAKSTEQMVPRTRGLVTQAFDDQLNELALSVQNTTRQTRLIRRPDTNPVPPSPTSPPDPTYHMRLPIGPNRLPPIVPRNVPNQVHPNASPNA